jgi:hypothetical protein
MFTVILSRQHRVTSGINFQGILRAVKDPTLSRQSSHRWLLGCQPYAPATLTLLKHYYFLCFWHSFLLEAEWTTGRSAARRIRWIEKNCLIRSQTYNNKLFYFIYMFYVLIIFICFLYRNMSITENEKEWELRNKVMKWEHRSTEFLHAI